MGNHAPDCTPLSPADDLLTQAQKSADELETAVRYPASNSTKGHPAGPHKQYRNYQFVKEINMYSLAISGVLFLPQAILVIKPLVGIGTLLCSGGSGDHCGV
ncbi:MAG: hypothetical protein H6654_11600 [Ardenticatenaceae bacterium]|nr:hypothetical protein [Anaerolineales bacterium]MCB8937624.1 hypothetical protein [Ardenticatenaceae bacterium]MCB8974193.1 hypothetical protein [Ardenticatenaceae bacterium]